MIELSDMLYEQVRCCLRYREQIPGSDTATASCARRATTRRPQIVAEFFDRIPAVRDMLAADVQAAFDGDPAAQSTDETIFCYPGLFAIFVQRFAHEFYQLGRAAAAADHDRVRPQPDRHRHPPRRQARPQLLHRPRHRRGDRRDDARSATT